MRESQKRSILSWQEGKYSPFFVVVCNHQPLSTIDPVCLFACHHWMLSELLSSAFRASMAESNATLAFHQQGRTDSMHNSFEANHRGTFGSDIFLLSHDRCVPLCFDGFRVAGLVFHTCTTPPPDKDPAVQFAKSSRFDLTTES